jgi:hypothetical protein
MSPKQKDRTTTTTEFLNWRLSIGQFQIGILFCSKGEGSSISKLDILKPS